MVKLALIPASLCGLLSDLATALGRQFSRSRVAPLLGDLSSRAFLRFPRAILDLTGGDVDNKFAELDWVAWTRETTFSHLLIRVV
jgi:hypothetical protein